MRFITDVMLGRLSRWLRLLGYDTTSELIEDDDILAAALSESRTLLTRDRKLINQGRKMGIDSILISAPHLGQQMVELLAELGLERVELDPQRSRCPMCNGDLDMVQRDKVVDEVPAKVREYHQDFWRCRRCSKIYWMGRHWENIEKKIDDVNAKLSRNNLSR